MVTATVDNTPITVLLDDSETFTPATGNVIKAFINVGAGEAARMTVGSGPSLRITTPGRNEANGAAIILDDTTTISSESGEGNAGVSISGFVVS